LKTKRLTSGIALYLISSLIAFSQSVDNKSIILDNQNSHFVNDSIDFEFEPKRDTLNEENSLYSKDTLAFKTLTYQQDTTSRTRPEGSSILKDNVEYNAADSTIYSIDGKKVYLFGDATIIYEDITLKAAYIEIDMEKNILYAEGVKDSLGKVTGNPVFTEGNETMNAKSLTYNVKTKKGFIKGLYTEKEDGYLHSETTKKEPDNSIDLSRGKYTTCELEEPHFYMSLSRAKVIPGKSIVAGYSYMVIEGVPLYPLMVPFGFFPTSKTRASGFLIPKFGEETNRGFYLREGGYYFAINDYVDLTVKGDAYSLGSWQVNVQSKYKLMYKFSGNVDLAYSKVLYGEVGTEGATESNQYRVRWTHTQDAKARPNSNFSANVNFVSTEENKYNSTSSEDYLTNTTSSSISYRKTFANTPFTSSMNFRHSLNNKTKDISLTLPQMTFNMNRIFPFRKKEAVGAAKWYENVGVTYAGNFENKSDGLNDTAMFRPEMWDFFKNGINHSVPLSTSVKVLKYFNLSPGVSFTDRMYFERTMLVAVEDTNKEGELETFVVEDEQKGFYNVYDYSANLSLGTTVYGMYSFKGEWLKAIRHVATPSVSLGYRPDYQESRWGYYYLKPDDTTGNNYYSPYSGGIYGVPGAGKSGTVSFSLNNNVEMKVASKNDTVNKDTKIKLLESLNFSTSYNLMADSMNWSPLNIGARTTLFKVLSIQMSANGDFYDVDKAGKRINEFYMDNHSGHLLRITNARASTGFSLNSKNLFSESKTDVGKPASDVNTVYDYYGYDYFDIPWNLNVDYSLGYSNTGVKEDINQSLSFTGDFSLTPKWKIGFRSGYDFEVKDISYTSFNLSRDLHCWIATLSIIPFGARQSYNFSIGAKSSVLQDLKYNKNQSWIDNAY